MNVNERRGWRRGWYDWRSGEGGRLYYRKERRGGGARGAARVGWGCPRAAAWVTGAES